MSEQHKKSINTTKNTGDGWIIGIGASAGGLEALTLLISNLPKDFKPSIIIAQHLAPLAKSMMVELLRRQSPLPVSAARDKEKLKPGCIYVIPPNNDVDIIKNQICLTIAGNETRPKPSVDVLFESIANSYKDKSIGIILSGTGSDGSKGITAIKSAGGITIAQDNQSAKYDGMPHSAVETGDVDFVLAPENVGKELVQIINTHLLRKNYPKIQDKKIAPILDLVKEIDGTDFRQYKMSTINRRIAKRIAHVGSASVEKYIESLKDNPAEVKQLSQEFLVSVTSFFRDYEAFQALYPFLEKIVQKKQPGQDLRVWVAGCATGEEAYSLAILLDDVINSQDKNINIKVFASDLDYDAISEARIGIYSAGDVANVPSIFLKKYFDKKGNDFEVKKRIRDTLVFARQDMIQNPPFVKVDLVSCRNVLIYFEHELQNKVFDIFHYALNSEGLLFLGKSESVGNQATIFNPVDKKNKIYSKLPVAQRQIAFDKMSKANYSMGNVSSSFRRKAEHETTLTESAALQVLNSFEISSVITDEDCNVLQIIGDVSNYLNLQTGYANLKLTSLLPKGVGLEIPILIKKCKKDGAQKTRTYKIKKNKKDVVFNIHVNQLDEEANAVAPKKLFVITFTPKVGSAPVKISNADTKESRVYELEEELAVTKEHLQTVVEELGITNEELQSLNEELQSTNEELQASGEELETTNEELQSTNEELTTLNEELNQKSTEVKFINMHLENIQNSIGSPLVVLDSQLRVTNFNDDAVEVFNIMSSDMGRDISRISSKFELEDFGVKLKEAVQSGRQSESVIEVGNKSFQLRILPSYDENKLIVGTVLIFLDNTYRLKSQERVEVSEHRLKSIINGAPTIIFVKDTLGRYLLTNESFRKIFDLEENEIVGKTDRELFDESLASQFRDADLEVFLKVKKTKSHETIYDKDGVKHVFLVNRFPLLDQTGMTPYAVGTVGVDITAQFAAQESLFESESRYKAIVEDQAVYVCRFKPDGTLNFVNDAFSNFFGGTSKSNTGQPFYRLVHEMDRSRVSSLLQSITSTSPVVQFEHRSSMLGPQKWIRWICRGIFNQQNKTIEYQAVGFDVTESRHQTDQLIEKDAVYSSIFNNTVDFLSVFKVDNSRDFVLESFNRSAQQAFGYISGQLVGKKLDDLIDPARAQITKNYYKLCVAEKKSQVFEEQFELPSGNKYYSTTLVPILNNNGEPERIAAVSRDISPYKNIVTDLRKAKEVAEIANKSKSEFLASMSHELRTPLNVVLGVSQLLEETASDNQKGLIGSIYRSGKVLLNLIEDILDVSRIEAGKIKLDSVSFNVLDNFKEIYELFHLQAKEKGIELILNIGEENDKFVIGDPTRLKQILINLVGNAIKFTQEGKIEINVSSDKSSSQGEHTVHVSVVDTGIGIAEENHSKLFHRFSQVDSSNSRRYGGSGLGLMISQNLVSLMNGQIGFQSTEGKGSTFWYHITLPLAKKQMHDAKVESNGNTKNDVYRELKILAAEDNEDSQEMLRLLLLRLGHEFTLTSNGNETIDKLKTGDYDVILLDIQMPGIDGYETARQIRKLNIESANIPIVALTANAMSGDAEKCFQAGMDDYLTKPIDLKALSELLQKWAKKIKVGEINDK